MTGELGRGRADWVQTSRCILQTSRCKGLCGYELWAEGGRDGQRWDGQVMQPWLVWRWRLGRRRKERAGRDEWLANGLEGTCADAECSCSDWSSLVAAKEDREIESWDRRDGKKGDFSVLGRKR